jgi:murein DD-endopeptidase MepM/ murein hydrolase activator NlpD
MLTVFIWSASVSPSLAFLSEGGFRVVVDSISTANTGQLELYRIKKGDTLWQVAEQYDVDLQTLMQINHLDHSSTLAVGQMLQIPGKKAGSYVIKPGDTMWAIAVRYNISTRELIALNSGVDPRNLRVGAKLVLPQDLHRVPIKEPSRSVSFSRAFFTWPLNGIITSAYGWRKSGFHHGLDIAAATGTPIKACAGGKVAYVGVKGVYGLTVIIDHYNGQQTLYAHTSKTHVTAGQKVAKGQVIAEVGATGNATGPHLHLEIKKSGETFNPIHYLQRL